MNIHDAVSPAAIATAKTLGYGLLAIAVVIVVCAYVKMQMELKAAYKTWEASRKLW